MKAENAYRTITEVSDLLQVPASVLRFWETQFHQIKPVKRMGRRYYQAEDVVLLAQIKDYLYKEGYTIKGVQKRLKKGKEEYLHPEAGMVCLPDEFIRELTDIKETLADYLD